MPGGMAMSSLLASGTNNRAVSKGFNTQERVKFLSCQGNNNIVTPVHNSVVLYLLFVCLHNVALNRTSYTSFGNTMYVVCMTWCNMVVSN